MSTEQVWTSAPAVPGLQVGHVRSSRDGGMAVSRREWIRLVIVTVLIIVSGYFLAGACGVDVDGGITPCLRKEPDNPCK